MGGASPRWRERGGDGTTEDERCEVSELLKKLHSDSYLDSRGFIKVSPSPLYGHVILWPRPLQAVSSVLSSLSQNLADYPQHRNAVATLVARGVAQVSHMTVV